jgi:hypothetical protein
MVVNERPHLPVAGATGPFLSRLTAGEEKYASAFLPLAHEVGEGGARGEALGG